MTPTAGTLVDLNRSDKKRNALTPDELVAQTLTITVAGQDTTANTIAFGLVELSRTPDFQEKLRTEIQSTLGYTRSAEVAYDGMPLLNAFVKEILRLYPAEAIVDRMAVQDTIIPLTDSLTTLAGNHVSEVPVRKGQVVTLAIASYQRLESRWGADAHEFNPSRWLDGTPYKGEALGPYANLMSFLGGPRTCLGWRFAVLEMQVFFCELIGKFSFALAEDDSVGPRFATTLFPIMSNGQKGVRLCITRIVEGMKLRVGGSQTVNMFNRLTAPIPAFLSLIRQSNQLNHC
ncbi:cytochrome P450, partial [Mycena leptocephala]